ncbi:hypothetical protein [Jannaschia sp. 2305UL9-9]|uniref:hypothetical protein n=1 Tax=Jannaschia sp. 2305UL9-9 TaxID=3121638 RepID=UPI003528A10D
MTAMERMANANWRRGLTRLWGAASVLWALFILILLVSDGIAGDVSVLKVLLSVVLVVAVPAAVLVAGMCVGWILRGFVRS